MLVSSKLAGLVTVCYAAALHLLFIWTLSHLHWKLEEGG